MNRFAACIFASALAAVSSLAVADTPASREARIDALFSEWSNTKSPGCAIAISRSGEIVYERGYGMANLEHSISHRPDTVIHVASVSKQFAAAAIALLVLEGKLSLDDPVRKYVPELQPQEPPVTIAHLVHHTSGLHDHGYALGLSGWRWTKDGATTADAMRVIAKQKHLLFEPGARYHYSNGNYVLLGQLVERITGHSLRQFTSERIFKPLGMDHTHFHDNFYEIVPGFAAGYWRKDNGFETSLTNFSFVGSSTLLTTARDLMKWEENFYTGRVGGQRFIDLMHTTMPLNDGKPNAYAFGIVVKDHRGMKIVEHAGSDAGYTSHLVRFPQHHLSAAVLCNTNVANATKLATRSAEIYLGLEPLDDEWPSQTTLSDAVSISESALSAKVGSYLNRHSEHMFIIRLDDGKLYVTMGNRREVLTPLSADRFSVEKGRWEFAFSSESAPAQVTVHDRYAGPHVLERVPEFRPSPAEVQEYVGLYSSDDLLVVHQLELIDGQLVFGSGKFQIGLTPITRELFATDGFGMRFERNAQGHITGLRYGRDNEVIFNFRKLHTDIGPASTAARPVDIRE